MSFGNDCEGIRLNGDPHKPEPIHTRIAFPGGDVEVVRVGSKSKPEFWVHIRVDHPGECLFNPGETMAGRLLDARLDIHDQGISQLVTQLDNPDLYHLGIRVQPDWNGAIERAYFAKV